MIELYGQQFNPDNPKSTFFHGDCLEGMKAFPDGYFDLILTDPPYNTTQNDWDVKIDLEEMFAQFNRIVKENGAILVFSQMPFTAEVIMANKKFFRYEWIWDKFMATGFLNANRMPMKAHENIVVFYKKMPVYNPQFSWGGRMCKNHHAPSKNYGKYHQITTVSDGRRCPRDIIRIDNNDKTAIINATQKPVKLMEYFILTYTNPKEIILDAFAGSGTTLIASRNTDRICIGFEKDDDMFKKAKERIDAESAQMNIYDLLNEKNGE